MVVIGLEGCSPLQPGSNKGPILGGYFFRQTKVPSISTAPRDRRPPSADRGSNGRFWPDRGRESAGSPSLRTGQALFTHPALQL